MKLVVVAGVIVGVAASRTTPPSGGETALHDLEQMPVLKSSLNTLLVVQLLVDSMLGLVRAFLDAEVNAVARRQSAKQTHAERKA